MTESYTKDYKFANTDIPFSVQYRTDNDLPLTITANKGGEVALIGTKTQLDLRMQVQVLTAIADWGRFKAYENELNKLSKGNFLLLKTGVDFTDEFAIAGDRGHINFRLEREAIVALQGLGIFFSDRYWPMDENKFHMGWGVLGQDSGSYYISKAGSPLVQARKMNVVRALMAGRQVTAYIAHKRDLFSMIMEGLLNENDEEAWQKRHDARQASIERKAINRAARKEEVLPELNTVTVSEDGLTLIDTKDGYDKPQTIIANLEMKVYGFKKKTQNLGTLADGTYAIFSRDAVPNKGGHIVYDAKLWSQSLSTFEARQWGNMIERGLQIEIV